MTTPPQTTKNQAPLPPAPSVPQGVQRVSQVLAQFGHTQTPRMLDHAARTAQQAADALGIALGQIVKSIVFRRSQDDAVVLVLTAGDRRVDTQKVSQQVGAVGSADAQFVKTQTGFSIGGVAPVGHLQTPVVLIDQTLARFDVLWAAAGHPHAVFALTLADLQRMTGAALADVAQDDQPTA